MSDEQLKEAKVKVLHFPTVLGADVPTYNLPGVSQELKFTPDALAGIFLGTIKKWDDGQLVKANPGVKLASKDIFVVHRSDGSGTTYVWTDYLSKISPEWKSKVGTGAAVSWPGGIGGERDEGVARRGVENPDFSAYVKVGHARAKQN